jgi:hypothetical protein
MEGMAMRGWVLVLAVCLGTWAWAQPGGWLLAGSTLVPAHPVAAWLGATLQQEGETITLTRGTTTLRLTQNRRAAQHNDHPLTLPAPPCMVEQTLYLPARAVADAFGATLVWQANTSTLTFTRADADPLSFAIQPFPRSPLAVDDTLAGLCPGDHAALAVALWGDPTAEEDSPIPGARTQHFSVDCDGLGLRVTTRGEEIVCVSVQLGHRTDARMRPFLVRTGTRHGARLAGDVPAVYGRTREDYAIPSEDSVMHNYRKGGLVLLARSMFFDEPGQVVTLVNLRLVRRGFPREWLQPE